MATRIGIAAFILSFAALISAQTPIPPALYVDAEDLAAAVQATLAERGAMGVGTVSTGDDFRINVIHRTAAAGAIVHEVGTELHFITAGGGTLVTGGIVVRPNAEGPAYIDGVGA